MKLLSSIVILILGALLSGVPSQSFSQTQAPAYVSIAYIKSKSPDLPRIAREHWAPVHRHLIKEQKKNAWYLYRVKYPAGSNTEYDYVRFNVFADWNQVEAPDSEFTEAIKQVHPEMTTETWGRETNKLRDIVWEQLHQVIGEAVVTKTPSQFIVVNEVKTVPGAESDYVKMELTYFKPFHAERVSRGLMNNWSLYKLSQPYGSRYDHDYVTLNGFKTWQDIVKNPPGSVWEKAHGNVNFDMIHSQILAKRLTVNNELWELIAFAIQE